MDAKALCTVCDAELSAHELLPLGGSWPIEVHNSLVCNPCIKGDTTKDRIKQINYIVGIILSKKTNAQTLSSICVKCKYFNPYINEANYICSSCKIWADFT